MWDPFGTKAASKIKAASAVAAQAAREAGEAQAKAFRFNADVYSSNADAVEEQALTDELRSRRQAGRFRGTQEAVIAGTGFQDVGFDGIREDTDHELDMDAIIIRRTGQATSSDWQSQAELALMNAETAIKAGSANAQMAILNGNIQAQQAQSSAISSTVGLALQGASIAMVSDVRVKENIEHIGVLPTGDRFYAFNYVWEPEVRRVGVMAQEIRSRVPAAVSRGPDGILAVDYSKLGLPPGYDLRQAIRRRS